MSESLIFPVSDAARMLGIGKTKLYQLIHDGQIEVVKIGTRTLVTYGALAAFVDNLQKAA